MHNNDVSLEELRRQVEDQKRALAVKESLIAQLMMNKENTSPSKTALEKNAITDVTNVYSPYPPLT